LVPIAISSVAGNQISNLLLGNVIVFAHRQFDIGTADIMVAFILAILCALNSIFFTRSLNEMHSLWRKATPPQWLKVFASGCLVFWLPMVSWVDEGCFALLGMTGLISGMLQAPLTCIMLIVEITGDYNVILPLIIVAVVSATVCRTIEPASFYLKELVKEGRLHRPRTDERILSDLSIAELLENDCISVPPAMPLRDFVKIVSRTINSACGISFYSLTLPLNPASICAWNGLGCLDLMAQRQWCPCPQEPLCDKGFSEIAAV
jgi:H+/Cl- antiporter ClcA